MDTHQGIEEIFKHEGFLLRCSNKDSELSLDLISDHTPSVYQRNNSAKNQMDYTQSTDATSDNEEDYINVVSDHEEDYMHVISDDEDDYIYIISDDEEDYILVVSDNEDDVTNLTKEMEEPDSTTSNDNKSKLARNHNVHI